MKFSLHGLMISALGAAAMSLFTFAVASAQIDTGEITLQSDRVQIVHVDGVNDFTNFNVTFTNNGEFPDHFCDNGLEDAIANGVQLALSQQTCESFCDTDGICVGNLLFPFYYDIEQFVSHTVNHSTYGNFFALNPPGVGPGTISARIVLLSTPPNTCGMWNLNVEATGLNLSSITHNPMSIWIGDEDNSGPFAGLFCFDINNAIIGNPIPKAPTPVRRW